MKTLKKMFAFAAVFAVIGLLTSCTKQDLTEDEHVIDPKRVQIPTNAEARIEKIKYRPPKHG